jgi:hypothetical protein
MGNMAKSSLPEDVGDRVFYMMLIFGLAYLIPPNTVLTSLKFFKEEVIDFDLLMIDE